MSSIRPRLFVILQHLLPRYLMTALVCRLTRVRQRAFKNFLMRQFVRLYAVNTDEAEHPVPDGYETFNAFFTRALAEGGRPVDPSPTAIVSPADGTLSAAGSIRHNQIFQAKGRHYQLQDLLATDLDVAKAFTDGSFATIYLAPYNYHRVHAPMSGELVAARYVPGDLYSVNATTVSLLPDLFARNERLVCEFRTATGPMIVILVGALNVGSISTPWTGEIRPRKHGVVEQVSLRADVSRDVAKGDLLGWFNMGSTVIVLFPAGACAWSEDLASGNTLRTGVAIGQLKKPRGEH